MKHTSKEFLSENGVYVGAEVVILRYGLNRNGKEKIKGKQKGKIIGLYPNIFTVLVGEHKESFRYSQLYEEGSERVRLCK